MRERVHILATCRRPELLAGTLLVFDSLRVGFPTADVTVWGNGLGAAEPAVRAATEKVGGRFVPGGWLVHDAWIQELLWRQMAPFWICDTDVIFWQAVEHWRFATGLSGMHTPEFFEKFTGTQYRERLHTCLMRIDPAQFRTEQARYLAGFPKMPFKPQIDFVRQQWQPERRGDTVTNYFYDTLAMGWHACGGTALKPEQLDAFAHLGSATFADLVAPAYPGTDLRAFHEAIYAQPERARGLWRQQVEYFEQHATQGV